MTCVWLYIVALFVTDMGYSRDLLIGLQNQNNTVLDQNMVETVSVLGIHKSPVSFTHRGKKNTGISITRKTKNQIFAF